MLKLVIPKGSLERATFDLFEQADLKVTRGSDREYRGSIEDPRIESVAILRPQEIPSYIEEGFFDIGVTGEDWIAETGANVSVLFVPPAFTKDACIEAIDAEIPLLVVITEGVPVLDTAEVVQYLEGKSTRMIGPNCPGIITPEESLAGITPHTIAGKGPVGLVSKSGTLTYQLMHELRDERFALEAEQFYRELAGEVGRADDDGRDGRGGTAAARRSG